MPLFSEWRPCRSRQSLIRDDISGCCEAGSSFIASMGHSTAQMPQRVQVAPSASACLLKLMAPCGHKRTQVRHIVHLPGSTSGGPGSDSCSGSGMGLFSATITASMSPRMISGSKTPRDAPTAKIPALGVSTPANRVDSGFRKGAANRDEGMALKSGSNMVGGSNSSSTTSTSGSRSISRCRRGSMKVITGPFGLLSKKGPASSNLKNKVPRSRHSL